MTARPRPTFDLTPKSERAPPPDVSAPAMPYVPKPAPGPNPVSLWNGEFALEFSKADGRFEIDVQMAGGLVRVRGDAVVRKGSKSTRVPVTLVLRFEDAGDLGLRLTGEMLGSHREA
jgi:hypothetical protein